MEKNILQTLFKFCSNIFLEELADRLGFKSKKVKEFIINCGDHHLSWQILTIIYEALAHELVYIYFIECKNGGLACNVDNFVQWRNSTVMNPNNFYYDLTFNPLLGLICYRI